MKTSMFSTLVRPCAALSVAALIVGAVTWNTQAQASITFHTINSATWPAGPDYATDVLGDPWDFCNEQDVAPDPLEIVGWSNFQVNTSTTCGAGQGTAGGTVTSTDVQFSLLFRGRYGILTPTRNGRQFPIDPSKYKVLSYRMNDPSPSTSFPPEGGRVNWFHYPWEDPSANAQQHLGGQHFLPSNVAGYAIYTKNLGLTGNAGLAWEHGFVRGLRLSPRLKQTGANMEETAALLGLSRKGLYLKRQRYGIEVPGATEDLALA